MKKILFFVVVGLLTVFTIGCGDKQNADKEESVVQKEPTNPAMDSLSIALGDLSGAVMGQKLTTMASDVDTTRVFKGIEYVANGDTSKHFIAGVQQGMMIVQLFNALKEDFGIPVNKTTFMKHMKKQWLEGDPSSESTPEMMQGLAEEMINKFKSRSYANDESKAAAMDSLCIALGTIYGGICRQQQLSADSSCDLAEAFKGVEYIAKADADDDSYFNGLQMGMQVLQFFQAIQLQCGMPINKSLFMKHLRQELNAKTPMSQDEMQVMQSKIEPLMSRVMDNSPKGIANKKAGEDYMKKLKGDKSYIFTKSGLAYRIIKPGTGKNFADDDVVKVIYTGKHINGAEFDSSNGKPVPFGVRQVIPGFAEMIKLMKPGGKVVAVIPGDLAYGPNGNQGIGPNETLIFEIETVDRQQ